MNKLDKEYLALCQDILDNGTKKQTRNGEVLSVFGRHIRHSMKDGFPLLTTKKIHFKSVVSELLWFLRGDTNIKYLLQNDCHIWVGDAYKNYERTVKQSIDQATREGILRESNEYDLLSKETFINRIKTDNEFAKKWGELGPIYGKQWRRWTKKKMYLSTDGSYENIYDEMDQTVIDQIAGLINDLKTNPDSRRLMVSAWNVGELDQMVLPPCHYGFQVYTRELSNKERVKLSWFILNPDREEKEVPEWWNIKKLTMDDKNIPTRAISLMWSQRSVDTALGWPFNVASYGLLLELLGKMLNMIPDELICNLGDVHIYNNHIDGVKEQISREPYPLPKLNINTEWWPTESGECGVGPIDAQAVLRSFSDDNFCKCLMEEDLQLYDYQSHPTIKLPLSN